MRVTGTMAEEGLYHYKGYIFFNDEVGVQKELTFEMHYGGAQCNDVIRVFYKGRELLPFEVPNGLREMLREGAETGLKKACPISRRLEMEEYFKLTKATDDYSRDN